MTEKSEIQTKLVEKLEKQLKNKERFSAIIQRNSESGVGHDMSTVLSLE